jgi:hypothetical protein
LGKKTMAAVTRLHDLLILLVQYIQEKLYCTERRRMYLWKIGFPAYIPLKSGPRHYGRISP